MKERIICGKPLSPRELIWFMLAMIALFIAIHAIFFLPLILVVTALGVSVVALGRAGFFRDLKGAIRNFFDYRLYYKPKQINKG